MSRLEKVLERCLTRLSQGEATLEECLARYPEYAEELSGLLMAAEQLKQGQVLRPSATFTARTRARLITHANANPPRRSFVRRFNSLSPFRLPVIGPVMRVAVHLVLILLLFMTTGTMLAQAAGPRDSLYDWRITSEDVVHHVYAAALIDSRIAERRVGDLIDVVDDAVLQKSARATYQRALGWLIVYRETASRELVAQSLIRQKNRLAASDLIVPELDALLVTYDIQPDSLLTSSAAGGDDTAASNDDTTVREADPAANSDAGSQTVITPTALITGGPVITRSAMMTGAVQTPLVESGVIYVQSNSGDHDLNLIPPTGSVTGEPLHLHAAAPAWSPDGKMLALFGEAGISNLGGVYSRGNGVWLLDIVDGQAQNPRQLVYQDHIKSIVWSSDGAKLAFEVGDPGQDHHEVVVVSVEDGQQISRFSGEHPAWRADSQNLIIKGCYPDCGLWQVDLNGTPETQLTFGDSDSYPAFSPAGEYLAFSSHRDGDWEIYLLRLSDNNLQRLTRRPGSDTTPVFDGRGRTIYLRTDHFGGWRITRMTLAGQEEQIVQESIGQSDDWGLARPAIR